MDESTILKGALAAEHPRASRDSVSEDRVRITEIFHSIQGESTWAGLPCTFVRLTGCPLRCVWCDTAYAFTGGDRWTVEDVIAEVDRIGCSLVEITGGEPLIQPGAFTLAAELVDRGYTVLVETSGSADVSALHPRVHKIMDLKCPDSGESERNRWENLDHLTARDEVKFVVAGEKDFLWARDVARDRGLVDRLESGGLKALLISPVWGSMDLEALAGWILESGIPFRFQVQLHKLVWGPEKQGV